MDGTNGHDPGDRAYFAQRAAEELELAVERQRRGRGRSPSPAPARLSRARFASAIASIEVPSRSARLKLFNSLKTALDRMLAAPRRAPSPAADSRSRLRVEELSAKRPLRTSSSTSRIFCATPDRRPRGAAEHRAELGGVGDRLAHAGDPARLDQLGDQLQLADAFEVGDFR